MTDILTIRAIDGTTFDVDKSTAFISNLLSVMLEDSDEVEVPVIQVSSNDLGKIIEFMEIYKRNPFPKIQTPLQSNNMSENVGAIYAEFIDSLSQADFFSLINAANYMQVEPLMTLCCCKIASYLVNKKKDEIPAVFGLPSDVRFDDEDYGRTLDAFPWAERFL